jgi:hypothetical protein
MSDTPSFKDPRLAVYCCGHLFRRERKARLVGRPDDDWQFLCGEDDGADPREPYHVSIGVLLEVDATLNDVADLPVGWEAERKRVGTPWLRTRCGAQDA